MDNSKENDQVNTDNQLLPDIVIKRPNFFYADDTAEEIESTTPKKTILHDSDSRKKLLQFESKRNNLFTTELDLNKDYIGKREPYASSQLTSTDFKDP